MHQSSSPSSTCGGLGQSEYLATQFTDTMAAKHCENMDYAGYTDWYLPALEELKLLFDTGVLNEGGGYLSVTEFPSDQNFVGSVGEYSATYVDAMLAVRTKGHIRFQQGLVRCVRRF